MTPYKTPEYHPAFEEYCETIFELREDDVDVIQARVAERLDVSRPAVSEMIRRMETQGLVTIEHGSIRLTDDGLGLAESVVRRHRLAERFLTDILDLSWADAHVEAGVEHAAMSRSSGPWTALGSPRPACTATRSQIRLRGAAPRAWSTSVPVARSPSAASRSSSSSPGLLDFLEASAIQPGRMGEVTAASPDGTTRS